MNPFITILSENAAYAGFALAWAVHFFTARSYGQTARLMRRQKAEGKKRDFSYETPVSVVIAAHNQAEQLRRNLPAVLEQDYGEYEVIVVNNASTDDTEDVLKVLELKYPHLHHTFTPNSSRHISHKRLSLTIGFKSAQYDWVILTEADSHPVSSLWLECLSRQFLPDTQIVLGYANYTDKRNLFVRKTIFFNLFHQMQYLPWAAKRKAYRANPANVAYRKDLFMQHKGFAGDIDLISGAVELLVNRHSTSANTKVSFAPESKVVCEHIGSSHLWRQKRTYYMETRRHFSKTWLYRLVFNLKQHTPIFFYALTAAALAWSILQEQWIGTGAVSFFFLLLMIWKTVQFNRSCRAVGERPYYFGLWWYELRLAWWHTCSLVSYIFAPRKQFRRKAF